MNKTEEINYTICDKCGRKFSGWEDVAAKGKMYIEHSSVIGDCFTNGLRAVAFPNDVRAQRMYFNQHPAVDFGEHPHQSLVLKYGEGNNDYHLCWNCNNRLLKMLGEFFTVDIRREHGSSSSK